jgi:hypothetical protein
MKKVVRYGNLHLDAKILKQKWNVNNCHFHIKEWILEHKWKYIKRGFEKDSLYIAQRK